MISNSIWNCIIATTACYYKQCPECGAMNVNYYASDIEKVKGRYNIKMKYKCHECGHEYKGLAFRYVNIPKTDIPVSYPAYKLASYFSVNIKGKAIPAIPLDKNKAMLISPFKEPKIVNVEKLELSEGGKFTFRGKVPSDIYGLNQMERFEIDAGFAICPNCGKPVLSNRITDLNKAHCKNHYKCKNCGKDFKEFRFFWNVDSKGNKVSSNKRKVYKLRSKKSGKEYFGILYNDGKHYLVSTKKEDRLIPLRLVEVVTNKNYDKNAKYD